MYRTNDGQISLAEFFSPFGKLDQNNRWVKVAKMIPWDKFEEKYAEQFCDNNGAPAIKFRMAMGTLIIKQRTGHSDADTLQAIMENPYMQYLIGLHEFATVAPFALSSITNFRKYITKEMINEVNNEMFRKKGAGNDGDDDSTPGDGGEDFNKQASAENKGTLMLDATCAPADITYPTDVNLLNKAREKLENIIDTLHPHTGNSVKPRTYRQKARRKFLQFAKQRRPRKDAIRKAVGQQLRYVTRNIKHISSQIQTVGVDVLSNSQREQLDTIKELYCQQKSMHETKSHSVEKRIVSISQPHVRPIVRGKERG